VVDAAWGPECDGLLAWLDDLLDELAPERGGLTLRLVDEQEMRRLNRDFRRMDRPTDVLAFPGQRTPEGDHLGDVVIALPLARRQAVELGHSPDVELRTLALHGVLHCLGYDHEVDGGHMEALELELRRRWIDPARAPGERRP
jgi:probable rRNA maturation factor